MVAIYWAPLAGFVRLIAGGGAGGHHTFPLRGHYSYKRNGRSSLEAIQRVRSLLLVLCWPRYNSRSPRIEGRGPPHRMALGQIIHLQPATAVLNSDIQRYYQRRRERDRADQYTVSTVAQLCRSAAQIYRPPVSGFRRRSRNRQP